MNTQLIQQMTEVVEATMQHFKSDFYKYDKPYVEAATPDKFPMIWSVAPTHTGLSRLMEFEHDFNNSEAVRMDFARSGNPFRIHFEHNLHAQDKFYLLRPNELCVIDRSQLKEISRDIITPVIVNWERENGKLEYPKRLDVKLHGITLSKLKELIQDCRNHGDDSLMRILKEKRNYPRYSSDHYIDIFYDKTYNEFFFREMLNGKEGMCGGIVFHGWPETGYQQNYSVQLVPGYGWSSHT